MKNVIIILVNIMFLARARFCFRFSSCSAVSGLFGSSIAYTAVLAPMNGIPVQSYFMSGRHENYYLKKWFRVVTVTISFLT